jgi:hypothetical protein
MDNLFDRRLLDIAEEQILSGLLGLLLAHEVALHSVLQHDLQGFLGNLGTSQFISGWPWATVPKLILPWEAKLMASSRMLGEVDDLPGQDLGKVDPHKGIALGHDGGAADKGIATCRNTR